MNGMEMRKKIIKMSREVEILNLLNLGKIIRRQKCYDTIFVKQLFFMLKL